MRSHRHHLLSHHNSSSKLDRRTKTFCWINWACISLSKGIWRRLFRSAIWTFLLRHHRHRGCRYVANICKIRTRTPKTHTSMIPGVLCSFVVKPPFFSGFILSRFCIFTYPHWFRSTFILLRTCCFYCAFFLSLGRSFSFSFAWLLDSIAWHSNLVGTQS
jgi:hypothetical protein